MPETLGDLNWAKETAEMLSVRDRNVIPNLRAQKEELLNRVKKIDTLLGLLQSNPDFVKLLDLTRELIW